MWISGYTIQTEIIYDQVSQFIGEFSKSLIKREYMITAEPSTSGNPTSSAILERIHQVQMQINKESICENIKRVDNDYKFGDKAVLNNSAA